MHIKIGSQSKFEFDFSNHVKLNRQTDSKCILRMALLDDVYKQIRADNATIKNVNATPPFRRIDGTSATNGADNEYEVGVASGYAIQHPIPSGFVPPQNHAPNDIDFENYQRYAVAGNKAGLITDIMFDNMCKFFSLSFQSYYTI